MKSLPDALAPLAEYNQFIVRKDKLPADYRTGRVGDAHNSDLWCDAQTAIDTATAYGSDYGVGFVFTESDPFFFVDIDKCLQNDNTWSDNAIKIMSMLNGAAVEVSQSGRGLHIIGKGQAPDHACKNVPLGMELYTAGRYVALTGTNAIGSADMNCGPVLPGLVSTYFPPKVAAVEQEWTIEPIMEWSGPLDDSKLIAKALKAKSAAAAFGASASFRDLWIADADVLAGIWPGEDRPYDESSADAALAQHLAFWTGNDCGRIERLMRQSGLVRDKWDKHKSYLTMTITRAISLQGTRVYCDGRVPTEPSNAIDVPILLTGFQYLAAQQQMEYFKGCVYIQDMHRIFIPNGSLLKSEQFNATYGGYVFQLESEKSGKVTRKAWEAFTESQVVRYPKAESMCFRPDLESGSLITFHGRTFVNTYVPIVTARASGDITPFLSHVAKVLPDVRDQSILLAYMAACIQYKGVKFQWAPLLQGVEGNGKTLFTQCVVEAIGERYSHMPPANEIAEKFNEWLFNKLFIGVEDVYVPDHKKEVIEILKPMITNSRLAMRAMQQSQVMGDNVANFMLNSNHKDAIRKTRTDRRFCVFYTAQQVDGDLKRDGMDGDYFPKLYKWLRKDGYARVAQYLETYSIPNELNPAGACHRAPTTSSTQEALAMSLGAVEQEIMEAIDEGRPGFAGGWVSSMALERLLKATRMDRLIPHNKRREVLQALGYDWHPALHNGRVNTAILWDGGKTRLFIKKDHLYCNLTSPSEVSRIYQDCQGINNLTKMRLDTGAP